VSAPAASTTAPGGDRTHPNATLAVLSLAGLAYAMLGSAVAPRNGQRMIE
jgi:hypothetical protein